MNKEGIIQEKILEVVERENSITPDDLEGQVHGELLSEHGQEFHLRGVYTDQENEVCKEIYRQISLLLGGNP